MIRLANIQERSARAPWPEPRQIYREVTEVIGIR